MNWEPTTYFPDLTEVLEDTVTFTHDAPIFFSLTLPRFDWERMGRPGRVTFEPRPVISDVLELAAKGKSA